MTRFLIVHLTNRHGSCLYRLYMQKLIHLAGLDRLAVRRYFFRSPYTYSTGITASLRGLWKAASLLAVLVVTYS